MRKSLQVYISSAFNDLIEERHTDVEANDTVQLNVAISKIAKWIAILQTCPLFITSLRRISFMAVENEEIEVNLVITKWNNFSGRGKC
ncbi:hypothetical protein EG487_26475 [Paenibacillus polymyxa]|nr:hypothetical protein EG487_26475 [Paenibacillus polymyxa]